MAKRSHEAPWTGGRRPKPTALKILEGTHRKDRENPDEPVLPPGMPDPPAFLAGRALEVWADYGRRLLDDLRVLSEAHWAALAMLSAELAAYERATAVIAREGQTYETTARNGEKVIRPRPEVAIAAKAFEHARRMLLEFGLTPASAGKVHARKRAGAKKDKDAAFFGKPA
jgi:P27 family predicted phage terminase small subunit